MEKISSSIEKIWSIINRLRGDGGCPWDKKQTPESVKSYIVEEAHEVDAAIRSNNPEEIKEELGDLLFMTLFMVHLFEEKNIFTLEDVSSRVCSKMISRHPHVFGTVEVSSPEEVKRNWEKIKAQEKKNLANTIPKTLPALTRAYRMISRNLIKDFAFKEKEEILRNIKLILENFPLEDPEIDPEKPLTDLLLLICQLCYLLGKKPEELLQKRLDSYT